MRPFPNVNDSRVQVSRRRVQAGMVAARRRAVLPRWERRADRSAGHHRHRPCVGPKKLFDARYFSANQARSYDVSRDGQRFLFIKDAHRR